MSEVMTKKRLESSEIQCGACKFCGKIYQFETDGMAPTERLDGWATEKCDCKTAQKEVKRLSKEENAKDSIEELIGESNPELVRILWDAVELILREAATKITMDTGKGTKVSVSVNSKGNIKVECAKSVKKSKEV